MFGIGSILGKVAGGLLDKIGLGKIAPFVKMGLNALTGNCSESRRMFSASFPALRETRSTAHRKIRRSVDLKIREIIFRRKIIR